MATKKRVCIIGAGNSGLGAAKIFKYQGHDVTIFERSHDIGGVWELSRSYPGIQTQSPKELYSYSDFSMPDNYPEWPSGKQVYDYFRHYAEVHSLLPLIQFNTNVIALEQPQDGQGWNVRVDHKGHHSLHSFDFVVVCSGIFSNPNRLQHAGSEDFKAQGGTILHSSEYTDSSIVQGKRVVILGFSKSATDIAVNAVKSGALAVSMVYRKPVWRIPYHFANVLNFKNILYSRQSEALFKPWRTNFLDNIGYALAKPFIWANWRMLEQLLKTQLKLKKHNMLPTTPIESEISCGLPVATPGFFKMIDDGRIQGISSTIHHYEGNKVVLTEGERLTTDVVIMAVGWEQGLPFLPQKYKQILVEPDGLYRLYRFIVNPDLPNLGFVGFNSSFASTLTAEVAAHWLVRYMDKQLKTMPTHEDMEADVEHMLHWRRTIKPNMAVYGGLCIAPYHFHHLDRLMRDMGAKTRRANPLASQFAPLAPMAYKRLLASAPDYFAS